MRKLLATLFIILPSIGVAAELAPAETTVVRDRANHELINILDFGVDEAAFAGKTLIFERVYLGSARISGVFWAQTFFERKNLGTIAISLPKDVDNSIKKKLFKDCGSWEKSFDCVATVQGTITKNGRVKDAIVTFLND